MGTKPLKVHFEQPDGKILCNLHPIPSVYDEVNERVIKVTKEPRLITCQNCRLKYLTHVCSLKEWTE